MSKPNLILDKNSNKGAKMLYATLNNGVKMPILGAVRFCFAGVAKAFCALSPCPDLAKKDKDSGECLLYSYPNSANTLSTAPTRHHFAQNSACRVRLAG